ncbi:DUF1540 domain-containing protein [Clostridium sp.]|uniref:DUF1540 domain-containing protein n=1 Tax=Clostridium sp. TaxID=1506 RepID=UPI00260D8434|nr:DUF1540 domain-containing protein [Clostridium sp.]
MTLIKCEAKTCINYNAGRCQAPALEIVDFTWYSEEEKEEFDIMKCNTYKYFSNWMYRK